MQRIRFTNQNLQFNHLSVTNVKCNYIIINWQPTDAFFFSLEYLTFKMFVFSNDSIIYIIYIYIHIHYNGMVETGLILIAVVFFVFRWVILCIHFHVFL